MLDTGLWILDKMMNSLFSYPASSSQHPESRSLVALVYLERETGRGGGASLGTIDDRRHISGAESVVDVYHGNIGTAAV
jgi:hypothetical protein